MNNNINEYCSKKEYKEYLNKLFKSAVLLYDLEKSFKYHYKHNHDVKIQKKLISEVNELLTQRLF